MSLADHAIFINDLEDVKATLVANAQKMAGGGDRVCISGTNQQLPPSSEDEEPGSQEGEVEMKRFPVL